MGGCKHFCLGKSAGIDNRPCGTPTAAFTGRTGKRKASRSGVGGRDSAKLNQNHKQLLMFSARFCSLLVFFFFFYTFLQLSVCKKKCLIKPALILQCVHIFLHGN